MFEKLHQVWLMSGNKAMEEEKPELSAWENMYLMKTTIRDYQWSTLNMTHILRENKQEMMNFLYATRREPGSWSLSLDIIIVIHNW